MRVSLNVLTAGVALAATVKAGPHNAHDPSTPFHVDGKTIPGISSVIGDVGSSWAGRLSINSNATSSDKYFFWLWPPAAGAPDKDLTIWFGGGPGCSGLGEMLQGTGPFLLPKNNQNKAIVQKNRNSWTQTGWVLYLDQPGVTGFSTVEASNLDEKVIAQHFRGFMANLYTTFPQLRTKNLYLSGESYAGQYIPHLCDALYNQTGSDKLPLKGAGIISGLYLGDDWQVEIPSYDYVLNRQKDLQLNATAMKEITKRANELGLVGYVNKTLTFPPRGPIKAPPQLSKGEPLSYTIVPHLLEANECFDYYNILARCPEPYNPLSPRVDFIDNTPGFKEAIHVSQHDTWKACTRPQYIFPKGDPTPLSMQDGSLSRTIDRSVRTVIYEGQDDFRLLSLGTQLGLQNITWGGKQGFQVKPQGKLTVNAKTLGTYHTERKLTWAVVDRAGHFVPVQQPEVALKMHKYLLGQIDESALGR